MFERLLELISSSLDRASIPYMVIGGQAVLLYGEARLTKDIDITLGINPGEISRLMDLLPGMNLQVLTDHPKEFVERTFVLPVRNSETGIRVDFIFSFTPYEQQAIGHANCVTIGKSEVRFSTAEDLVIHKIFSGRPRDIEDVTTILRKNSALNTDYVRKWLRVFDESQKRDLLQTFDKILGQT